jgi:hypothetical protein
MDARGIRPHACADNWSRIDATVAELERLVCAAAAADAPNAAADRPGDHARTLKCIERCVTVIDAANVALPQCFELRMAARQFYADRGREGGGRGGCGHQPIQAAQTHLRMRECIARIRSELAAMLKAATATDATDAAAPPPPPPPPRRQGARDRGA